MLTNLYGWNAQTLNRSSRPEAHSSNKRNCLIGGQLLDDLLYIGVLEAGESARRRAGRRIRRGAVRKGGRGASCGHGSRRVAVDRRGSKLGSDMTFDSLQEYK